MKERNLEDRRPMEISRLSVAPNGFFSCTTLGVAESFSIERHRGR